jgi:hypothetical protein
MSAAPSSRASSADATAQPLAPRSTTPALRPEQEKFNDVETEYLEGFLDRYLAVNAVKKGDKKNWVKKNIYPDYIKHFDSERPEGPNLSSLLKVRDSCRQMLFLY